MRDQELEERLRTAVEHAAPNALDRILASCGPQTQSTAVVPMRRPHTRRRWAALARGGGLGAGVRPVLLGTRATPLPPWCRWTSTPASSCR